MRAARTSALTLVSDDHVPPLQARERFILRNEADGHLVGGPGPHGDAPRACYVGDVRPSRGLFTMLEAVAASPPWTSSGRFAAVTGPRSNAVVPSLISSGA